MTPGKKFRNNLKVESPLRLVGTVNAYIAKMAKKIGFKAIYLSGAGVANSSYGWADIGLTTLEDVLVDVNRIVSATDLPLIVDIDTGFDEVSKTIRALEDADAAGVHIEDQREEQKRCGHLEGKKLISVKEMCSKLEVAVENRSDPDFYIIARTDALAVEGWEATLNRAQEYAATGVDALFPEALTTLDQYKEIKERTGLAIVANLTEFGKTPLFSNNELKEAGVDIALYPLSLSRVMYRSAEDLMKEIRHEGTQKKSLEKMQTREELYRYLDYKP